MIKVNIYDRNCEFLKQLTFNSLVLVLEQMLSGNFYYCELVA